MKKSVLKKIKFKKSGKIIRLPMALGHNRTRKSSKLLRNKRRNLSIGSINKKLLTQYLHSK